MTDKEFTQSIKDLSPELRFTRLRDYVGSEDPGWNRTPYQEFLASRYWQIIRDYVEWKYEVCQNCGSEKKLRVHHLTYIDRGREHEHAGDLTLLCDRCHKRRHGLLAPPRRRFKYDNSAITYQPLS